MAKLIVVSAPSGTGKSTVCAELVERFDDIAVSISYTTRKPRGHERNGVEYHFVSDDDFDSMVEKGMFLEWARVFNRRYGTAERDVNELLRKGKDVLFDIDVQGGMKIKEKRPEALLVFILPPSIDELVRRLTSRATESDEQIHTRIAEVSRELVYAKRYDAHVLNDTVDHAVEQIDFLRSEACRGRCFPRLDKKLEELISEADSMQSITS